MDFQYDFHLGNGDNGNLYTAANNKDTTRTQAYTYDTLNRILTAKTSGTDCTVILSGSQTKFWGESFTYEAWGNLTGKASTQCSAENTPLAANAYNQLAAYTYDTAGNLINNGGATYTYDAESELAARRADTRICTMATATASAKPTAPAERCIGMAVRGSFLKLTCWAIRSRSTSFSADSASPGAM